MTYRPAFARSTLASYNEKSSRIRRPNRNRDKSKGTKEKRCREKKTEGKAVELIRQRILKCESRLLLYSFNRSFRVPWNLSTALFVRSPEECEIRVHRSGACVEWSGAVMYCVESHVVNSVPAKRSISYSKQK